MLTVKGFVSQAQLADNRFNTTAIFGELSSYARTFTKDITVHTDPRWANTELNVFSCKLSGTGRVSLSTEFKEQMLEIGKWVYDFGFTAGPTVGRQDFLVAFMDQFQGKVMDISCGEYLVDGLRRMPQWLAWKKVSTTDTDNSVKVWFNSASFEREYDEYEIIVVPPLANLNTFFRPTNELVTALAARSVTQLMELAQEAKGKKPETTLRVESVDYVSPNNPNQIIPTNWAVVIYGPAGESSDNIKAAIVSYILANSQESANSWKVIIPDLFRTTQMFVLPRWDLYAIPNRTDRVGIYSPITRAVDSLTFAKSFLAQLAAIHIENHLQITHSTYRSLVLLAVGGPDNHLSKFRLTDYVPDYIAESSTSEDFNRQSELTKTWTIALDKAILIAEVANDVTDLPTGYRRVTIGTKTYIAFKHNKVEYLVATKASMPV